MDGSIRAQYQARLTEFSAHNQQRIVQYLELLAARHYTPTTITAVVATLNALRRHVPVTRQQVLTDDLTLTTSQDIAAFLAAGQGGGPGSVDVERQIGAAYRVF